MRKFNYLLLGAAALTMASCSNEDLVGPANGDGNFNITVKLPGDMATRSLSDGKTADNLKIAVYDADNDNAFVFEDEATFGGALQTTVSLNLPQGKEYTIAFFAVSDAGESVYDWNAQSGTITAQYANYISSENLKDAYDCFFNVDTYSVTASTTPQEVTLYRPVAQVNWGTSDINAAVASEDAFGENGKYIVSNLTIENGYSNFDILTGNVTGEQAPIKISALASPAYNAESAEWTFPVQPNTYQYIAMQYVLAPNVSTVYDFTLNVDNENNPNGTPVVNDVVVSNAPVQANYRTNIYGALLTNPTEFYVEKEPIFANENNENHVVNTAQAFMDALAEGGYVTLNSNVTVPDRTTLTKDVVLDLNGYTITYSPTGEYTESKEGVVIIPEGVNLTIKGNGGIQTSTDYLLVWVNGGNLTIEGGYYSGPFMTGNLIYCYTGNVYIKGGTYYLEDVTPDTKVSYPLNCYDSSYKAGTAHIYVSGGTFYNWNPGQHHSEGGDAWYSFLENGYKTITTPEGDITWFTVVPEDYAGTSFAVDSATLQNAVGQAQSGESILVLPGTYTFPSNSTFKEEGIILDCQDGVIFQGATQFGEYGINGATVKNAKFSNTAGNALGGYLDANFVNCVFEGSNGTRYTYLSANTTFQGCSFIGTGVYAFHVDSTVSNNKDTNPTLTMTDCFFDGFVAMGASAPTIFNKCTFVINPKSNYGGGNFYGTKVFNDCEFYLPVPRKSFQYIALAIGEGSSIIADATFNNCYNNGELITIDFDFAADKGAMVTCNGQTKTFN